MKFVPRTAQPVHLLPSTPSTGASSTSAQLLARALLDLSASPQDECIYADERWSTGPRPPPAPRQSPSRTQRGDQSRAGSAQASGRGQSVYPMPSLLGRLFSRALAKLATLSDPLSVVLGSPPTLGGRKLLAVNVARSVYYADSF
jgi:hypothetical protein